MVEVKLFGARGAGGRGVHVAHGELQEERGLGRGDQGSDARRDGWLDLFRSVRGFQAAFLLGHHQCRHDLLLQCFEGIVPGKRARDTRSIYLTPYNTYGACTAQVKVPRASCVHVPNKVVGAVWYLHGFCFFVRLLLGVVVEADRRPVERRWEPVLVAAGGVAAGAAVQLLLSPRELGNHCPRPCDSVIEAWC